MASVILVIELIGVWLLFGAPLLQATTELYEEVSGWDKIKAHHDTRTPQSIKKHSFWWWLLPPLKIYLEKRRIRKIKQRYAHVKLSDASRQELRQFSLKVNGWSGVTLGGWLVAISTTWDFSEACHLGVGIWITLVLFFSYVSILINIKLVIHRY